MKHALIKKELNEKYLLMQCVKRAAKVLAKSKHPEDQIRIAALTDCVEAIKAIEPEYYGLKA